MGSFPETCNDPFILRSKESFLGLVQNIQVCLLLLTLITSGMILAYNHNYNKIVKSDWLLTALISALTGQFNRTVRGMPK